jgi:Skp family chaperone for outer membrane proteins
MSSLFEDLQPGLRDGIDFIVDKTDEMSKIGKAKIDMLSIKRNIEKLFSELGGRFYEKMSSRKKVDLQTDEEIARLVAEIKQQEKNLDQKKDEIKKVKLEKEEQRKSRGEEREKRRTGKSSDSGVQDADIVSETDDKE